MLQIYNTDAGRDVLQMFSLRELAQRGLGKLQRRSISNLSDDSDLFGNDGDTYKHYIQPAIEYSDTNITAEQFSSNVPLFCKKQIEKMHTQHQERVSVLKNQLEEEAKMLELANKNITFLVGVKQKERDEHFKFMNDELQKAKADLEYCNNFLCYFGQDEDEKSLYEENIKEMLVLHEMKLEELTKKFNDAATDLRYLERLKEEHDKIINELHNDKSSLRIKLQQFDERNTKTFNDLQSLIYEKELLVKKLDEKEKHLVDLQKKYSHVLEANSSLKIDLDDARTYLTMLMRKELEGYDSEILILMMDYVHRLCDIQDQISDTEKDYAISEGC